MFSLWFCWVTAHSDIVNHLFSFLFVISFTFQSSESLFSGLKSVLCRMEKNTFVSLYHWASKHTRHRVKTELKELLEPWLWFPPWMASEKQNRLNGNDSSLLFLSLSHTHKNTHQMSSLAEPFHLVCNVRFSFKSNWDMMLSDLTCQKSGTVCSRPPTPQRSPLVPVRITPEISYSSFWQYKVLIRLWSSKYDPVNTLYCH